MTELAAVSFKFPIFFFWSQSWKFVTHHKYSHQTTQTRGAGDSTWELWELTAPVPETGRGSLPLFAFSLQMGQCK